MVSALHSGSSGLAQAEAWTLFVFLFLGKHLTLTVALSAQMYKWVLANLMLGITLQWTSISSRD